MNKYKKCRFRLSTHSISPPPTYDFIEDGTVDHHLVKTIEQFVNLVVQVKLQCLWDNGDIESMKCGTIGIKPTKCTSTAHKN